MLVQNKKERMNFKNFNYKRSVIDDFMNNKSSNQNKVALKFITSVVITLLVFMVDFGISIILFLIKNALIDNVFGSDIPMVNYQHNIINIVEVIKQILFDYYFRFIAIKLVSWIDPKYIEDFESYFIALLGLFGLLNNFFILYFILIWKDLITHCSHNKIKSSLKGECLIEAELLF